MGGLRGVGGADSKGVFVGRAEAELGAAAKQERSHVHAGARSMRGDKLCVQGDGHVDGARKEVFGRGGHGDEGGAVLHALGVQARAEHVDGAVIGGAEGLEALVALLAVVEARGEAVNGEEGGDDKLGGAPDAGVDAVVGLDVAVDFADAEADVGPVWGGCQWVSVTWRGGNGRRRGGGNRGRRGIEGSGQRAVVKGQ